MQMELVITLLTAILTILGSGVVAAWVSHDLVKKKEELYYRRTKLEELYKAVERFTTLLFVMNHIWPRVMDGELSFNQGLGLQVEKRGDEEKHLLPEIDMLINLYFPQLLSTYKQFVSQRDIINRLYSKFRDVYKVKGPTITYEANREEFSAALMNLDVIAKGLLSEVAQCAHRLK